MQRKQKSNRSLKKHPSNQSCKKQPSKQQTVFEPKQVPLKTQFEARNYSDQYLKQRKRYLSKIINQANRKLGQQLRTIEQKEPEDGWNKVEFNKIKKVMHFHNNIPANNVMSGEMFYQMVQ